MTEETNQSHQTAGHPGGCMCCKAKGMIGRVFREFGPSGEATDHFRQSRVEFLKGIRRLVDDQIERASRDPHARGSRIVVD
jgi:hypothetical protein